MSGPCTHLSWPQERHSTIRSRTLSLLILLRYLVALDLPSLGHCLESVEQAALILAGAEEVNVHVFRADVEQSMVRGHVVDGCQRDLQVIVVGYNLGLGHDFLHCLPYVLAKVFVESV